MVQKIKPPQKKTKVIAKDGTEIMLTPSQKKYADIKMDNPDISLSEVARRSYPNATKDTIRQIVNMNEKNKNIALYSGEQLRDAQTFIHETINNPEAKIRDRLTAAFRVEDRNLGTVVQQIQQTTTGITLNIDLSSALTEVEYPP
jgi:hypothetical protein